MTTYFSNNENISNIFLGSNSVDKIYRGQQEVYSATQPLSLDAPIENLDSFASFGFDRNTNDYTGNTVRLRRLSDNAEENFGFSNSTYKFDLSAVDTWRSGADVDVVHFKDQKGSSITLNAIGTASFIRSDLVQRFQCDVSNQIFSAIKTSGSATITVSDTTLMAEGMLITGNGIPDETLILSVDNTTTLTLSRNCTASETSDVIIENGMLARSNDIGGVGCVLDGNAHFETSSNLTADTSTGVEISILYSPNKRKRAANRSDIYGGNADRENLVVYGIGNQNYLRGRIAGGNLVDLLSLRTSVAQTLAQQASNSIEKTQYSQHVNTFSVSTSDYGQYTSAGKELEGSLNAQGVTDISNGTLDNGKLVVGADFANSTGTVSTSSRADILFGAVIVHRPLTDNVRWNLLNKLEAIAEQEYIDTKSNILAMFDDVILHKNINTVDGSLVGENNNSNFAFNLPAMTTTVGTPSFIPNYTIPGVGVVGLRSTDNNDNNYVSNDAIPPNLQGTVFVLSMSENTGGDLTTDFAVHNGTPSSGGTVLNTHGLSLGLGRDHGEMSCLMRPYDISQVSTRFFADRVSQFGKTVYDGDANQADLVYNRNVVSKDLVYGETIQSIIRNADAYANHGPNDLGLDAPVIAHVAENISNIAKDGKLTLMIVTFNASDDYNPADPQATRLIHSLKSDNRMYLAQGHPFGHRNGSIARNRHGGVVHHGPNAKFQSYHGILQSFSGVRVMSGYSSNVLTDQQIRKLKTNLYKILK